jgi:hypothetical protein
VWLPAPSRESLVRLLVYIIGAASTVVGSLVASKIRVYHDNRTAHLTEIKERVLKPIYDGLTSQYHGLVEHRSPVVNDGWGVIERRDAIAGVTQSPIDDGPILKSETPDVLASADITLYTDAKQRHFRKQIEHLERFLEAWHAHVEECRAWVSDMSNLILAESALPAHPSPTVGRYIMNQRLGVFLYRRLFHNLDNVLLKSQNTPGVNAWKLEGFGALAGGIEQEIDDILACLNRLITNEKDHADLLLKKAAALEQVFSSLCRELNYAMASRALHRRCDLVPFF